MTKPDPLRLFSPDREEYDEHIDATSQSIERDLESLTEADPARTVTMTLGEMVPLLMDAVQKNRLWLTDFADEPVEIDADLHEVLLAYQRMRRRDAA